MKYGLQTFSLDLAGQQWDVDISEEELSTLHRPLLDTIISQAQATSGRYIVLLAGPPGCGKTTLGALWEILSRETRSSLTFQTLPMDGFHLPNAILDAQTILRDGETIPLRKIKGAPESYNRDLFHKVLKKLVGGEKLAWPRYDRQIHDPVPDAIPVAKKGIFIIEGNYVLLNEPVWRDFKTLADMTIFIECDEPLARERVVARLQRGGRTYEIATTHYEFNDKPNWQRVMNHRLESDVVLRVEEGGRLLQVKYMQ